MHPRRTRRHPPRTDTGHSAKLGSVSYERIRARIQRSQQIKHKSQVARAMNDKNKAHDEIETMIRQFGLGAHIAIEMMRDGQLSFDSWYEEVTKSSDFSKSPTDNLRLIWIWNSLRQDPALGDDFRELSPAGMRWNRNSQPFLVLKRHSWLVIGLSQNAVSGLLSLKNKPPQEELASFQLLDDLRMRPGRNDRLECCEVPCLLLLRPNKIHAKVRELDILGVAIEQIKFLDNGLIQIEVPSINQAYTVASRRLEPERRSHGGNIYEHVVYVGNQVRHRLEDIRLAVELGEWKEPPNPETSFDHPVSTKQPKSDGG